MMAANPTTRTTPTPPRRRRRAARGGRWRARAAQAWRGVTSVPPPLLTAALLVLLAIGLVAANAAHWVIRKPTELLLPVAGALVKTPAETWRSYAPLFRRYSTAAITPELLAALAQVESAGNPAAQTYWRWNPEAPDLFGIYRPASSSVGMYQMTDPAYADARRYCIRDHAVVAAPCGSDGLQLRVVPGDAVELTAVFLDRGVAAALGRHHGARPTPRQERDVAAILHLCGAGPARAFVARGFRLLPGGRCGDHDPAAYLAQVVAMEQRFLRLAAE